MKFNVQNGPHIKNNNDTLSVMMRLLISLMPIICFSIFKNIIIPLTKNTTFTFDILNPIFMIMAGITTSYITEVLYCKFIIKENGPIAYANKSYAIIPGFFVALLLPLNTPIWVVIFGAFCGTFIGKLLNGGFGQNIFNPALIGYLLISVSYGSLLGGYLNSYEIDAIGGATPLTNLASLNYISEYSNIVGNYGSLFNFLIGMIPGGLGEVSKILIIFSFIYLTITKTIKWRIPVFYVSTVFVLTYIIGSYFDLGLWYPLFHILSGGLLFGAVFMSTDPVTSPITSTGQIFYGISLGILTVLLRFLTPYPEGVMTSILFMNLLVFLFDKYGIKIKYNFKRLYIYIILFLIICSLSVFLIINNLSSKSDKELDSVKIINKEVINNNNKYTITSTGWGTIKGEVITENKKIKSINILDSTSETEWPKIEENNYIDVIIEKQDTIDEVDSISGCTYTSNGLKNIVKKVLEVENEK